MEFDFSKIATILDRIKTPLTLGGLVVVVLYGIYSQILKLPSVAAAALSAGSVAQLLQQIITYLFWLAILAVVLGVGSYLAVHFFPKGLMPDPDQPVQLKADRKTRAPRPDSSKNRQNR